MGLGIGMRSGESDITRTSTETQVDISWRIAKKMSRVVVIVNLVLYVVIWAIWSQVNGQNFGQIIDHLRRRWIIWALFIPIGAVVPFIVLVIYDYHPKLLNSGWPFTTAQYSPEKRGAPTFYGMNKMRTDKEAPQVIEHVFEGTISNGEGQSKYWRMKTKAPAAWKRYARALTRRGINPRFSVREAKKRGIPEKEFVKLAQGWCTNEMAKKTSHAKNAHTKLLDWGKAWLERMADQ